MSNERETSDPVHRSEIWFHVQYHIHQRQSSPDNALGHNGRYAYRHTEYYIGKVTLNCK